MLQLAEETVLQMTGQTVFQMTGETVLQMTGDGETVLELELGLELNLDL